MLFPELKELKAKYKIPNGIIESFDLWLAYLKKNKRTNILSYSFAKEYDISYESSRELFFACKTLGVLEINYEIHCQFCDNILDVEINSSKDIPDKKLLCEVCSKEFNPIDNQENIIISFSLIKEPSKKKVKIV